MCHRPIIVVLVASAFLGSGSAFAQPDQPETDYQSHVQEYEQHLDEWNEQAAEHQRFRWYAGVILVVLLVVGISSHRRYTQSVAQHEVYLTQTMAKYDVDLKAQQDRWDQLFKTLESIERRLGGG